MVRRRPRIRVLSDRVERDPRETLDVFIGGTGFFAFAFFVVTVVAELTGQDALGWALALLALVALLAALLAGRHRMTSRLRARQTRDGHPAPRS